MDDSFDTTLSDQGRRIAFASWGARPVRRIARTPSAEIWLVTTGSGQSVLKIWPKGPGNELAGTRLMRAWAGSGVMVDVPEIAPQNTSICMTYLDGPSLGDIARAGNPGQADNLLAKVAWRLHRARPTEWLDLPGLDSLFAPLFQRRFAPSCPPALRAHLDEAAALAASLLATSAAPAPLHGDLHHDNVILTAAGPVAFDAKGLWGDPAYELANALRHPRGLSEAKQDTATLTSRIALFAKALTVDPHRLTQWAAAKCALSIVWRAKGPIWQDTEADLLASLLLMSRTP